MDGAPAIRLAVDGPLATLRIANPPARNALTRDMWRALPGAVAQALSTRGLRAIVVRGEGSTFSAGADLKELAALADRQASSDRDAFLSEMTAATQALASAPVPVIAAIEGPCIGAGLAVALACHVRLAAANATFATPPARLGLAFPAPDVARLIDAVGPGRARALLVWGEPMTAREAHRIGLVEAVLDDPFETALAARLGALTALSPVSHRATLALVQHLTRGGEAEDDAARALFTAPFAEPDFAEGAAAFREKRAPRFAGEPADEAAS